MSSAKPPSGSRQVPVTNCIKRRRTSLSTSFTNCKWIKPHRQTITSHQKTWSCPRSELQARKWTRSRGTEEKVNSHLPEPDDLFAVACVVTIHCVPLPVLKIHFLHATQHHLHTHTHRWHYHKACQTHVSLLTSSNLIDLYCLTKFVRSFCRFYIMLMI